MSGKSGAGQGGSGNAAGAGPAKGGSGDVAGAGPVSGGSPSITGGSSSLGGAIGTAGTMSVGGGCACDPIECAPGYVRVANGYDCCDHCLSIACAQERAVYLAYRPLVLDEYATVACTLDTDCGFYYEANPCGLRTCGIPLAQSVIGEVSGVLGSYAQKTCGSSCPTDPEPPCDDPPHAVCVNGRCQ